LRVDLSHPPLDFGTVGSEKLLQLIHATPSKPPEAGHELCQLMEVLPRRRIAADLGINLDDRGRCLDARLVAPILQLFPQPRFGLLSKR